MDFEHESPSPPNLEEYVKEEENNVTEQKEGIAVEPIPTEQVLPKVEDPNPSSPSALTLSLIEEEKAARAAQEIRRTALLEQKSKLEQNLARARDAHASAVKAASGAAEKRSESQAEVEHSMSLLTKASSERDALAEKLAELQGKLEAAEAKVTTLSAAGEKAQDASKAASEAAEEAVSACDAPNSEVLRLEKMLMDVCEVLGVSPPPVQPCTA